MNIIILNGISPFYMLLFIFFASVIHQSPAANDDVAKLEENIKLMDNVLETLTIPSNPQDDELEMLNKVIDGASDLLSLVNDTASVLVKVASVLVPKPDSVELKAIKELNKMMVRQFDSLAVRIENLVKHVECELLMEIYDNMVKQEIAYLWTALNSLTNLPKSSTEFEHYRKIFVNECDADKLIKPWKILEFINRKVNLNCPIPHHSETPKPHKPQDDFCKPLSKKGNFVSSSRKDHHPINLQNDFPCYPQKIMEGNEEIREHVLAFAQIVNLDLVQTATLGVFCVNMAEYTEAEKEVMVGQLKGMLVDSSSHLKQWIEQRLKFTWPNTIMTYAIKAIGDMDVHVDDDSKRQEISQKIVQETMKRGPIHVAYQHHIWPIPADGLLQWSSYDVYCQDNDACLTFIARNLRVVIHQLKSQEEEIKHKTAIAGKWLEENIAKIKKKLRHYEQLNAADFLRFLMEEMPITNYFRTVIVMNQHMTFSAAFNSFDWKVFDLLNSTPYCHPWAMNYCCCNCERLCSSTGVMGSAPTKNRLATAFGSRTRQSWPFRVMDNFALEAIAAEDAQAAKCNNRFLQMAIVENISADLDASKRRIQAAAERALGTAVNVICGASEFTFVVRAVLYCQASGGEERGVGSCYAFTTAPINANVE